MSVLKLAQLLDKLVDFFVACQRKRVFLDHRFLMFDVGSLSVVWVVVLRVGSCVVVGCGCVVKLIGTSPCTAPSIPLPPPPRLCLFGTVWTSAASRWLSRLDRVVMVLAGTSSSRSLWMLNHCCCTANVLVGSSGRRHCVKWAGWVVLS